MAIYAPKLINILKNVKIPINLILLHSEAPGKDKIIHIYAVISQKNDIKFNISINHNKYLSIGFKN